MAIYSVSAEPLYYTKRPQCGVIWDECWMIFIVFPLNSSQELQISNFKYLRQLKVSYKFIWKHVFSGYLSIALTKKGLQTCCYYCCSVFDTNISLISTLKNMQGLPQSQHCALVQSERIGNVLINLIMSRRILVSLLLYASTKAQPFKIRHQNRHGSRKRILV